MILNDAQGHLVRRATMSAVDEEGHAIICIRKVFHRLGFGPTDEEVVVSPGQPMSSELCCILGSTRLFLWQYFNLHYPH